MQWAGSHAAGFTTGTPWITPPENYRQINAAVQVGDRSSIRAFYKRPAQLRKEMAVISEGRIEFALRHDPNVLCCRRFMEKEKLLVLCNLTGLEQTVSIGDGWNNILLSNRERAAFDGKLLPYDCVVLTR